MGFTLGTLYNSEFFLSMVPGRSRSSTEQSGARRGTQRRGRPTGTQPAAGEGPMAYPTDVRTP
jgi:hypothetical protein